MRIEEKIKKDTIVVSDTINREVIDYLYYLSDEAVITFFRCSMSILASRMMEEDDIDIKNEEEWATYHRKVIGCAIDSMDDW